MMKEYIFRYENELLSEDYKKILSDKAVRCIRQDQELPYGIELESVKYLEC